MSAMSNRGWLLSNTVFFSFLALQEVYSSHYTDTNSNVPVSYNVHLLCQGGKNLTISARYLIIKFLVSLGRQIEGTVLVTVNHHDKREKWTRVFCGNSLFCEDCFNAI